MLYPDRILHGQAQRLRQLQTVFSGRMLRKCWPLFAALALALVALAWSWQPGAAPRYLREPASPFEVCALVLFLMPLLPRALERLHLPGLAKAKPIGAGTQRWSSTWPLRPAGQRQRGRRRIEPE